MIENNECSCARDQPDNGQTRLEDFVEKTGYGGRQDLAESEDCRQAVDKLDKNLAQSCRLVLRLRPDQEPGIELRRARIQRKAKRPAHE